MENVIVFESSVKTITVNDANGEFLTNLRIDTGDVSVKERFAKLIRNLEHISSDFEDEAKTFAEKYKGVTADDSDRIIDALIEESRIHVSFLEKCAAEVDALFGEGTIKSLFADNFKENPDFVPDEYAILDFIDKVIPVMNNLFKERFERNNAKYNIARRGKHNKTKAELIEEHKANV